METQLIMPKPEWLKIKPPSTGQYGKIKEIIKNYGLHTVCQEAHCPNMSECWSGGTATFMVMGDTCTRGCKFCAVKTGNPAKPLDPLEPEKLALALKEMHLFEYVVITSVDRDDLSDQGSNHFAQCITKIKEHIPGILLEVLIPDFRGNRECAQTIVAAKPDVIAHNLETVKSLQRKVRDPRAGYEQSLAVLQMVKELNPKIHTKSSLMLGLGEQEWEVLQAMQDLRSVGVDIITFGQYLRPSLQHLPVREYVRPEQFRYFKKRALEMGFLYCASGPFVRSSYRAGELFLQNKIYNK